MKFERFTDRARRALVAAQEEAVRTRHFISPEHFLVGVLSEAGGLGERALSERNVSLDAVRDAAERVHPPGPNVSTADALASLGIEAAAVQSSINDAFPGEVVNVPNDERPAFSVDGKLILEHALRQAVEIGSGHIGTEHLLLGVLVTAPNYGTKVLAELGVDPDALRTRVVEMLTSSQDDVQ